MSSHREAPEISKDPVADNADVYAFVSPDDPSTVTMITNFVPLQEPAGGPNFYEFGDDVAYSIYIDNDGDGKPEISYVFKFHTTVRDPKTFLYNVGPITSIGDPNWNRRQFYSVTRVDGDDTTIYGTAAANPPPAKHGKHHKHHHHHRPRLRARVLARGLACPPCNIGPHSIPNYAPLEAQAIHALGGGAKVFAGQRREGFYVDLGAVFDLADLRPFQAAFGVPPALASGPGVDATKALNIHSIAIQVPIEHLTANGKAPTGSADRHAVIGVWSAASRRTVRMINSSNDEKHQSGPWVQVSRLGNPLINEVVIPLGQKDYWNGQYPAQDKQFLSHYKVPELSKLLPSLYPGVFPNLKAAVAANTERVDLEAILLTGIPAGVIKAVPSYTTFTGKVPADQLRLNVAIPPASSPSRFGLLGNDIAGFPNGRRVGDDVVAIELRAIAGATLPLVDPSYTADGAASAIQQWQPSQYSTVPGPNRYLSSFPYLGTPLDGFDNPSS
jgi:hypothetical protein